jgi:hypothetical protein
MLVQVNRSIALHPHCRRELGRLLPCCPVVLISAKMPSRPVPDLPLSASLSGGLTVGPCLQAATATAHQTTSSAELMCGCRIPGNWKYPTTLAVKALLCLHCLVMRSV